MPSIPLFQPMQHFMKIFEWLIRTVVWLYVETSLWHKSWTNGEYFISIQCILGRTNNLNLFVLGKFSSNICESLSKTLTATVERKLHVKFLYHLHLLDPFCSQLLRTSS
jgi:hypothetical protein